MALKGNLHDFSITQLFNLINLAGKSGMLGLENETHSARVYFKQGKLLLAELAPDDGESDLATLMLDAGKITREQAKTVCQRARSRTDRELALLLIGSGYCTQRDIVQAVKAKILQTVYPLFTWTEGSFYFDPDGKPDEDRLTVTLNLEHVIMEGTRWIKEWSRLQDDLPGLDVSLKFVAKPDARLRNVRLTSEEWRVISYVSPKNTIRQIAKATHMSEMQIRQTAYRLMQAGLVETVRPEAKPSPRKPTPEAPSAARAFDVPSPKVDRGLLSRLIQRIRSLA